MSLVDDIMAGRAEAEAIMYDTCVAHRPGAPATDADGVVATPLVEVYAGPVKLQTTVAQAGSPVAGGHAFTVENVQLHFPVATSLQADDAVAVTDSLLDPANIGRVFRLIELARGSQRTAARWNAELVTA